MGRATVRFLTGAGEEAGGVVEVESTGFGRKAEVRSAGLYTVKANLKLIGIAVFYQR